MSSYNIYFINTSYLSFSKCSILYKIRNKSFLRPVCFDLIVNKFTIFVCFCLILTIWVLRRAVVFFCSAKIAGSTRVLLFIRIDFEFLKAVAFAERTISVYFNSRK